MEEWVEDGGEEADEGGEVEKVVVWRFVCCCCFEGCGCCCGCACRFEEGDVEEVGEADDIRGVVALSVMCMASEGCCEGRLAMLAGWLACWPAFPFGREEGISRWGPNTGDCVGL